LIQAGLAPLRACILIGGASRRMGRAKHLIELDGQTLVERLVAALTPLVREVYVSGAGRVPASLRTLTRLTDPPGVHGPIAGLCAAFERRPRTAWLLCACDMPMLSTAALAWLIGKRAADRIAILPRVKGSAAQPLPAIYEPRARAMVLRIAATSGGPRRVAEMDGAYTPVIPERHRDAFRNANTPSELAALTKNQRKTSSGITSRSPSRTSRR
jgi:molybdopterin-guanine dinucleotide biosynthesis protein A